MKSLIDMTELVCTGSEIIIAPLMLPHTQAFPMFFNASHKMLEYMGRPWTRGYLNDSHTHCHALAFRLRSSPRGIHHSHNFSPKLNEEVFVYKLVNSSPLVSLCHALVA